MDRLLKRIQRVRPAAFCNRDFFLLTIMRPPTKLCLPIFDPKKCYNTLSPPVLSRFISARLFYVPHVENEVKRTPICECCWDPSSRNCRIKEGPKRGIFGSFSEIVRPQKSLYISQWRIWHSEVRASWYILIMKANEMHRFSNFFDKVLYMFRTGPLSIIRNISTLYTRNRYLSC